MSKTDYISMRAGEMLEALGDDAAKWAAAYVQIHGGDKANLRAWFANAIEHSTDVRRWRLANSPEAWADYCDEVALNRRVANEAALSLQGEGS